MDYQQLASQLRRPQGDFGLEVAAKMNENNVYVNRRSIDILNIAIAEKVLEIGMANGYFCAEIVCTRQAFYTGCDFSAIMVSAATKRNLQYVETSQASFHLCEASKLPFPDQTFDKVFTVNTLYFFQHPLDELAEIRRVMKPNAKFVIGIRSKESMEKLPMVQYGFQLYDDTALQHLLEEAGFRAVTVLKEDEPIITMQGNTIYFQSLFGIGLK
jgi:ubiquinone/menaquinone biosynthesis C-methylase UbiE